MEHDEKRKAFSAYRSEHGNQKITPDSKAIHMALSVSRRVKPDDHIARMAAAI